MANAKTTLQLYRDCLRVARHIKSQGNSGDLFGQVKREFKKNMFESDPEKIQKFRENAIRALSNYYLILAQKEAKVFKQAIDEQRKQKPKS